MIGAWPGALIRRRTSSSFSPVSWRCMPSCCASAGCPPTCGFSRTSPTSSCWPLPGSRRRHPLGAPQATTRAAHVPAAPAVRRHPDRRDQVRAQDRLGRRPVLRRGRVRHRAARKRAGAARRVSAGQPAVRVHRPTAGHPAAAKSPRHCGPTPSTSAAAWRASPRSSCCPGSSSRRRSGSSACCVITLLLDRPHVARPRVHGRAAGRSPAIIAWNIGQGYWWSPYYKIGLTPTDNGDGWALNVNESGHQAMLPSDEKEPFYRAPYELFGSGQFQHVLIIGAGSGSDTAIGLKYGNVGHIDAVEIDPVIARLGAPVPSRAAVLRPARDGPRRRRTVVHPQEHRQVRPDHLRPARLADADVAVFESAAGELPVHRGSRSRKRART